jgi:hypothetical protein
MSQNDKDKVVVYVEHTEGEKQCIGLEKEQGSIALGDKHKSWKLTIKNESGKDLELKYSISKLLDPNLKSVALVAVDPFEALPDGFPKVIKVNKGKTKIPKGHRLTGSFEPMEGGCKNPHIRAHTEWHIDC